MQDPGDSRAGIEDILFLALTRPAMIWGVPSVGCALNVTGSVIISAWLGMGSWHILAWIIVLLPSIHFLMKWGVARDHNFFRTKLLYLETKGRSGNTGSWGGSTLGPLPNRWPAKGVDLPLSIAWGDDV